ncbi:MAG: MarR family winged helix-turn-helix transcriptional regulator [Asticcacaulis sp.]|uniref:MarR family winged helix-turn-helix transcriptional regulator n=1 Tax=Asticcacaulis sp. TaxID=1872648 RepID=UPI0039E5CE00
MSKNGLDESPSHLLHRVLQIALDIYNAEAGEDALSQRQYAVLKALEGTDGLSQTDLVKLTGIDRSTLADLVSRMLAKALVVRERSATDARANLVRIAEGGKTALTDMEPRVLAADEKILSLLSPPKRDSFVKLLRKLTSARESELSGEVKPRKEKVPKAPKAEKPVREKKPGKKKDKFSAKKMKKLPFPPLSEGAAPGAEGEDLVHAPIEKTT